VPNAAAVSVLCATVVVIFALLWWDYKSGELRKEKESDVDQESDLPMDVDEMERYWAYYELQYERVGAHESNRLQVSNFVLAGSVVALGLLAQSGTKSTPWVALVVSVAVILVNALAILFSGNSRNWVKIHQERAAEALKAVSPSLRSLQKRVEDRNRLKPSRERNALYRSNMLTSYMHSVVAIAAAALLIAL
jgi:hypothetical protein